MWGSLPVRVGLFDKPSWPLRFLKHNTTDCDRCNPPSLRKLNKVFESTRSGIGTNTVTRQNNIVYKAEISPYLKLSPCIIHVASITRALNEGCRSGKGSENGSRPENSPLCRGIELVYLAIHAEPLWLVFLKSRLKKLLSRMI